MRNFQDTFETCRRSFISNLSICMTVPLRMFLCFIFRFSRLIKTLNKNKQTKNKPTKKPRKTYDQVLFLKES